MRLALLSDLHANRQALSACLAHARTQGVDRHAFLGDLVGYGADPVWVVEQVMALQAQGALVIQGNHDAMAVTPPQGEVSMGSSTADWTHRQLRADHRRFLADLPLTASLEHLLLVHASAIEIARRTRGGGDPVAGRRGYELDGQGGRPQGQLKLGRPQGAGDPEGHADVEVVHQDARRDREGHPRHAAEEVLHPHVEPALAARHRARPARRRSNSAVRRSGSRWAATSSSSSRAGRLSCSRSAWARVIAISRAFCSPVEQALAG